MMKFVEKEEAKKATVAEEVIEEDIDSDGDDGEDNENA